MGRARCDSSFSWRAALELKGGFGPQIEIITKWSCFERFPSLKFHEVLKWVTELDRRMGLVERLNARNLPVFVYAKQSDRTHVRRLEGMSTVSFIKTRSQGDTDVADFSQNLQDRISQIWKSLWQGTQGSKTMSTWHYIMQYWCKINSFRDVASLFSVISDSSNNK